jgi:acyl-CoA synthetase (AMP-forming)/AMP-acid ligase II
VPKIIVFTDTLPTSATGKLMKGKLKEKIGGIAFSRMSVAEMPC